MTQYEYITATSGVWPCSCVECFALHYGSQDDYCGECDLLGCEDYDTCQRDDIYEEC